MKKLRKKNKKKKKIIETCNISLVVNMRRGEKNMSE